MNRKLILLSIVALTCVSAYSQQVFTLDTCRQFALRNNAKMQNARLSVEMAKQTKKEAFTNYFPSVSASGMAFRTNKPMLQMEIDMSSMLAPMANRFAPLIQMLEQLGIQIPSINVPPVKLEALKNGVIGGVMATQPLFAGGQIINGNRLAKAGVEVSELQQQMIKNDVLLATEIYYWQLISLQEKMKTIVDAEKMLNRVQNDVKTAVDAGLTTRNDLLRVELEQNRLSGDRLKIENGIQILKMAFGQHIGVPADSFDIQQPDFNNIALPPLQVDNNLFLPNRPEYRLLQKSVDVAKLKIQMEVGQHLPTVAIGAGYQYINFDLNKSYGLENNFGLLFANVSIPITDWWGGSHAIKKKKLELKIAENTRSENADMLLLQMQQVTAELNEAYQQVRISEKSIATAEENARMSENAYKAGVSILSDLLDAQNLLQQSRDQYTEAATNYYAKLAEYRKVMGTK